MLNLSCHRAMVHSNQIQGAGVPVPSDPLKQSLAGCLKAVAQLPDLTVEFAGDRVHARHNHVVLPEPGPTPSLEDRVLLRGQADALALWLAKHDTTLHAKFAPKDVTARQLFEKLEKVRVEAIGANTFKGMATNLAAVLEQHYQYHHADYKKAQNKKDLPVEEALALLLRERLTGLEPPISSGNILPLWREDLEKKAGSIIDRLVDNQADQLEFAQTLQTLLERFSFLKDGDDEQLEQDEIGEDAAAQDTLSDEQTDDEEQQSDEGDEETNPDMGEGAPDVLDPENEDDQTPPDEERDTERGISASRRGADHFRYFSYKTFTTEFDETVNPEDLIEAEELVVLRSLLDKQLIHVQKVITRLANRLQRRLLAQQNRDWEFDCEEGMLDPARLTRIVTDPFSALSFKQELDTRFRDTVVTLLIDNSGSMRGRQITIAASCADILARTLERCGVKVEILGFTTRAWKGGQAKELWLKSGKPPEPGRLNDLRHIIYKSADVPWRRAKNNLGLMLRDNLLKENIDGEALSWAFQRLVQRPEQRRILMVISDGTPIDEATNSCNPADYLEMHLHSVIEEIEHHSSVELVAIGIGYDVTRFYQRAVTIHDVEELGGAMMEKLAELFVETGSS